MSILSASLLILLLLVVVAGPRRWALLGLMSSLFCLTQGHALDVAGLNVFPVRVLTTAATARVLMRGELTLSQLNRIDLLILLAYNYSAAVWILRSSDLSAQQVAAAVDPTLGYLAFRGLVGSLGDVTWMLRGFVGLLVPFTLLVASERWTGHSAFTAVGASPELLLRDGVARCQGSFRHAILLGSVAASLLAQYVGAWLLGASRVRSALGAALCLILVFLTNSGGPVTSTAVAFLGWMLWPLRGRLRYIRWAALSALLILPLFMKAPIWYLPFKVSAIVGGGGYHRGLLMERAWQHLDEWWLFGMDLTDTVAWMPTVLDAVGGADVTNHFLAFGLRGGLLSMILFVTAIALAFREVGRSVKALSRSSGLEGDVALVEWGLGVALAVHAVSWLGVSYFDQSNLVWLMHLAAVSGASSSTASGHVHGKTTPPSPGRRAAAARTMQQTVGFVTHERNHATEHEAHMFDTRPFPRRAVGRIFAC